MQGRGSLVILVGRRVGRVAAAVGREEGREREVSYLMEM
jgi:hypothetical protein